MAHCSRSLLSTAPRMPLVTSGEYDRTLCSDSTTDEADFGASEWNDSTRGPTLWNPDMNRTPCVWRKTCVCSLGNTEALYTPTLGLCCSSLTCFGLLFLPHFLHFLRKPSSHHTSRWRRILRPLTGVPDRFGFHRSALLKASRGLDPVRRNGELE